MGIVNYCRVVTFCFRYSCPLIYFKFAFHRTSSTVARCSTVEFVERKKLRSQAQRRDFGGVPYDDAVDLFVSEMPRSILALLASLIALLANHSCNSKRRSRGYAGIV